MGLFSWLFGKREPERVVVRDRIWQTVAAKLRGAGREVNHAVTTGRAVLLLAHFPATLAAFGEELTSRKLTHQAIPDNLTPAEALKYAAASEPRVFFGLAGQLRPDEFPSTEELPPSPLAVIVLERHFLRTHDDVIMRFAASLGNRTEVVFHASLEDALMRLFAGEWVANVLRQLSMKEDETIESAMVSRRLVAAQAKIAREVEKRGEERPADSPDEWLSANFPQRG